MANDRWITQYLSVHFGYWPHSTSICRRLKAINWWVESLCSVKQPEEGEVNTPLSLDGKCKPLIGYMSGKIM